MKVDMSPQAVTNRLNQMGELWELSVALLPYRKGGLDKPGAIAIAEQDLKFYRGLPYSELERKIGGQESFSRVTRDKIPYQIEFNFFYDDAVSRNIRVIGSVSYSGWTDFFPVSGVFIVAPTGEFIGEEES